MKKNVLITGGTGLIGQRLTEMLLERDYLVTYLSRDESKAIDGVSVYHWDIEKETVDPRALDTMDYLIHLAGAGIADERWTDGRKKVIVKSRTETIELLGRIMKAQGQRPKAFVSASAIGYYGGDTGDDKKTEQSPPGDDFLAEVTVKWEKAADCVTDLGVRTVKLRTGVVLSDKSGALPKIAAPARFGMGAPLGDGSQWMSWIHIDDMCRMYIEALENENWEGVYNAVASLPVTNADLTKRISKVLDRPQWIPKVPEFALDLAFGEMSEVVLGSSYVENTRLQTTDFTYQFPDLDGALQDLLGKK